MSSGSKKKEPRYTCLSEAKVSHSQRMWAEDSSSTPNLLHKGLLVSPIKWRCLLRVLCPVRRPITTLDCVLLKDKSLPFAPGLGPKINSRACLWLHIKQLWCCKGKGKGKGKDKVIPLQAWTGPEGSRRLRLPDFKTFGTWMW